MITVADDIFATRWMRLCISVDSDEKKSIELDVYDTMTVDTLKDRVEMALLIRRDLLVLRAKLFGSGLADDCFVLPHVLDRGEMTLRQLHIDAETVLQVEIMQGYSRGIYFGALVTEQDVGSCPPFLACSADGFYLFTSDRVTRRVNELRTIDASHLRELQVWSPGDPTSWFADPNVPGICASAESIFIIDHCARAIREVSRLSGVWKDRVIIIGNSNTVSRPFAVAISRDEKTLFVLSSACLMAFDISSGSMRWGRRVFDDSTNAELRLRGFCCTDVHLFVTEFSQQCIVQVCCESGREISMFNVPILAHRRALGVPDDVEFNEIGPAAIAVSLDNQRLFVGTYPYTGILVIELVNHLVSCVLRVPSSSLAHLVVVDDGDTGQLYVMDAKFPRLHRWLL